MNYEIPDYKKPPKQFVQEAKDERARRKQCHDNWQSCESHINTEGAPND